MRKSSNKFKLEVAILFVVTICELIGKSISIKNGVVQFYYYPNFDVEKEIPLSSHGSLKLQNLEQIFIVIDGFLSDRQARMSQAVKNVLLSKFPESSVVVVDWGDLSGAHDLELNENTPWPKVMAVFSHVKSNVGIVAEKVVDFLELAKREDNVDFSKIHIIGFSLGAHIAGIAGMKLAERKNQKIGRITGLDPPGHGFPIKHLDKRLDKSDAEFVDVFFTNRYVAGDVEFNVGHVDVYVNGGKKQPGCDSTSLYKSTICNHAFAWKAWNKCLDSKCIACPCHESDCHICSGTCTDGITVGLDASLKTRGDFYLTMETLD